MADWVTKELGFIVEIESQQIAPTAFPDEIFSHYSLPAFDAIGGPLAQAGRHIESRKFRLVQSAVLVSKLNPRKMRVQAFEFTGERRAVASTEFMVYVPRVDDLNLPYLKHLLSGTRYARRLQAVATGTTNSHVRVKPAETLRWLVRVPPLEEQRRIADVLDTIDGSIRASESVLAKLGDLRSALLAQLALQCADNGTPVPLNSVGDWLSGGTPNTNEPSFWGGPIPWITASSLREKYLSRSTRTLTAAGVRAGSRLVPPGTLICVVRGMSLKSEFRVGVAAVPLAFGQDCKALQATGDWLPAYLHLQLSARESEVLRLVDEASHGTGRLQMPLLGALLVDRISLTEQQRVVTLYQAHEKRVSAEEAELAKLRRLRAGLAADLLSGRVRTVAT
ncbi:hypothetical protein [Candidatus Poriferisocius sp.]|uniref:restriction endonuclease subunit S n=1 Tax=Candidatus Poriferisocius sp. TaxID=3101276 RepID=UPI003B52B732